MDVRHGRPEGGGPEARAHRQGQAGPLAAWPVALPAGGRAVLTQRRLLHLLVGI